MESESSQYLSPCTSSLPPPQSSVESFLGSFVTLITNNDLRYEGVLYYLNLQNPTLGLQNVICYGTEGRRNYNGFQIPPFNKVYDYIIFSGIDIKEIIVTPPSSFTCCGYCCLGRGAISNKPCHATKPPLPLISYNPPAGAMIPQKLPQISNEKLNKPQATTDFNAFSVKGLVNILHSIASNPHDHVYQSMPCGVLNQDPINAVTSSNMLDSSASYLTFGASFFTTFPPAPISIQQTYGGNDFGAMTKNFNQYELWERSKNKEEETAKPAYNIEGSFYKISRKPFEPIGRPYNPFGPIARPVKHTEVLSNNLQRRLQLQPPPSIFRGGYNTTF